MNRLSVTLAFVLLLAFSTSSSAENPTGNATENLAQQYEPSWESIAPNYQFPEWYQDAKFGIWPHWGIYSVPAYRGTHAAEWYGRWMHGVEKGVKKPDSKGIVYNEFFDERGLKTAAHHRETYGTIAEFGYHDFAEQWKAEKFDADAWAQMAVDSGAKFFCMMAQHHDSFSLYDSDLTEWDSVDKGPKRDLCQEIKTAVKKRGLKFGVSNHMAWNANFFRFYHTNGYAKLPGHEKYADLYSKGVIDEAYLKRWWDRTTEAVNKLEPDLYYFDWGWNADPWREGDYHRKFTAYLYNRAIEQGKGTFGDPGVVLCVKQKDVPTNCAVRDLERHRMGAIQSNVWQTDTSISVHSWGYAKDDEYFSPNELIDELIDIVSKNGVLMLNFGPKADGTVPAEYRDRLLAMGDWLKICGESIYATRPFDAYGENPTKQMHEQGHKKIRFTRSKDNHVLYAVALEWPGETLHIRTLNETRFDGSEIASVQLLGSDTPLDWQQDAQGLHVSLSEQPDYEHAFPVRIEFSTEIPKLKK